MPDDKITFGYRFDARTGSGSFDPRIVTAVVQATNKLETFALLYEGLFMAKYIAIIAAAALGCAVAFQPTQGFAKTEPVYTGTFSDVAVSGYDPAAYFTTGRPVKGSAAYKVIHKGAEYHFASAANLSKFKANPATYAPQYGGYCAWAVSQGYTASGDPTVWKIVGGKLYLNYNREVGNTWEKNIPGHIRSANTNWPKLLAK